MMYSYEYEPIKNKRKPRKYFSPEEDKIIQESMLQDPPLSWEKIADLLDFRTPRQCKDRWLNYLSPSFNRNPWSTEEDELLIEKVQQLGKKWTEIERFFSGRSNNQIKNRWHFYIQKDIRRKSRLIRKTRTKIQTQNIPNNSNSNQKGSNDFWDEHISEDAINLLLSDSFLLPTSFDTFEKRKKNDWIYM